MKIDLNKVARKIEVNNHISLVTTTASPIIFSVSLISENVPLHQDYQASLSQARLGSRKRLQYVINELESLKPEFDRQVDELNREDDELHRVGSDFHVVSYSSDSVECLLSTEIHALDLMLRRSSDFLPPNQATLSRHSFLGPNGLKSQWVAPSRIKMMVDGSDILRRLLPSFSVMQLKTPFSLWNLFVENEEISYIVIVGDPVYDIYKYDKINFINDQLSRDVVVNQSQTMISREGVHVCNHHNHINNGVIMRSIESQGIVYENKEIVDVLSHYLKEHIKTKLRWLVMCFANVVLKIKVMPVRIMEDFLRLARSNTKRNLETCGVLAGSLKNRGFYITTLIIPKQESTSDSPFHIPTIFIFFNVHCQTLNEEEIFEVQDILSLFPLGWIHTHPTETCFMSSVDLHTHYSYQIMLPEAVAIVMARTDETTPHGIFHLSDPSGVFVIRNCQQRGFHPHEKSEDSNPIYEHCSHVFLNAKLKYEVLELR
ncbi:unnamed protein product [Brassica napus]|uniref:(rape) hypothetical protein n=1 Tax=Brassica napus TaxID=3708 RepID=A0A816XTJ8_BRANA|nr:unnamed protein product [Brassica napus]